MTKIKGLLIRPVRSAMLTRGDGIDRGIGRGTKCYRLSIESRPMSPRMGSVIASNVRRLIRPITLAKAGHRKVRLHVGGQSSATSSGDFDWSPPPKAPPTKAPPPGFRPGAPVHPDPKVEHVDYECAQYSAYRRDEFFNAKGFGASQPDMIHAFDPPAKGENFY